MPSLPEALAASSQTEYRRIPGPPLPPLPPPSLHAPCPFYLDGAHPAPSPVSFLLIIQISAAAAPPQRGPTHPVASSQPVSPYPCTLSPHPAHASFPVWPACFSSASDTKPEAHAGRGRQCLLHSPLPSLHGTWHVLGALIYFFSE